jgi:hypothetical protein
VILNSDYKQPNRNFFSNQLANLRDYNKTSPDKDGYCNPSNHGRCIGKIHDYHKQKSDDLMADDARRQPLSGGLETFPGQFSRQSYRLKISTDTCGQLQISFSNFSQSSANNARGALVIFFNTA